MIRRIAVKGGSGSGKTSVAAELAQRLGVSHVELDALHHGPNWEAASPEELRARVNAVIDDAQGWVVDGNYERKLGTLVLDRAELVVWLDLPLRVKLRRLWKRTRGRIRRREALWNGNRETWRGAFWGRESLFAWTVRTHFTHRRRWPALLDGRNVVRLRSEEETAEWLGRGDRTFQVQGVVIPPKLPTSSGELTNTTPRVPAPPPANTT